MSTKEQTYDFSPSPNDTTQHNFFSFADTIPPKAVVRELAVQLANYYFQCDLSRNKWSKEPAHICHWQIEVRQQDKPTFLKTEDR